MSLNFKSFSFLPQFCSSGDSDEYDVQMEDNVSTTSEGPIMDNSERMILSSSTCFDGTDLVGSTGKRLVKRGFVKKTPTAKSRVKKPKTLKNKSNGGDERTIVGYKLVSFRIGLDGLTFI